jgi:hypothetical protein
MDAAAGGETKYRPLPRIDCEPTKRSSLVLADGCHRPSSFRRSNPSYRKIQSDAMDRSWAFHRHTRETSYSFSLAPCTTEVQTTAGLTKATGGALGFRRFSILDQSIGPHQSMTRLLMLEGRARTHVERSREPARTTLGRPRVLLA